MSNNHLYTTKLCVGLGLIEETKSLLDLWNPSMNAKDLYQTALESGAFPGMAARRLHNLIFETFGHRYLVDNDYPAKILKKLKDHLSLSEFTQLLFLFTARANSVLTDFVKDIYWNRYAGGSETIKNEDVKEFLEEANYQGKTANPWADSVIERVAGYLTRCCADFGMLQPGRKKERRFIQFHMEPSITVFLAYDLHFKNIGDNAVISHPDWQLFGLLTEDVEDEVKRLALKDFWIIQSAAGAYRIAWKFKTWEDLINGISQ